jgi:hypothetical protein
LPKAGTQHFSCKEHEMAEEVKDRPGPGSGRGGGSGPAARGERGESRPGESLRDTAEEMRQQAAGVADHAKHEGKAAIGRQKDVAAREMDSVAGALHDTAQRMSDSDSAVAPAIGRYVGYAAEQLEHFGQQLRGKDIDTLIDDATELGRRSPTALFAGSMVAGFLLARFLKSSSQPSGDMQEDGTGGMSSGRSSSGGSAMASGMRGSSSSPGMPSPGTSGSSAGISSTAAAGASATTLPTSSGASISGGGAGGLSSAPSTSSLSDASVTEVRATRAGEASEGGRHGR